MARIRRSLTFEVSTCSVDSIQSFGLVGTARATHVRNFFHTYAATDFDSSFVYSTQSRAAATNLFFLVLASLVDSAPLGCLSSRQSAVEWVTDGSHSTPIVLSTVVIDQCKCLLLDSYVRNVFTCAIDEDIIGVDSILPSKNDKDKKYEKEMAELGSTSAASLAAKEARLDRTKGFWQSSKWAKKLSKGVNNLLASDGKSNSKAKSSLPKGAGSLVNTSSISRQLAHGKDADCSIVIAETLAKKEKAEKRNRGQNQVYTTKALFACRTYACVISRWGGNGNDDIVGRAPARSKKNSTQASYSEAVDKPDPIVQSLLNTLSFSTPVVKTLWALIQSDSDIVSDLYALMNEEKS